MGFGYNRNGQLGIANNEFIQNKSILIMKDDSISFIINRKVENKWTSENNIHFSSSFKQRILLFVLFLKRNQQKQI